MDKSPDAFRTISEVADWLNTPAHVLRFWESRFSQVKPVKRAGGRRYYRPSDMVLLGGIKKLLHEDGMTIRGVQKLLREHGVRYVASMSPHADGVTPVVQSSESQPMNSPIPAAPMAEDVPTGAYDEPDLMPAEKVVPFARPDFPPSPQNQSNQIRSSEIPDTSAPSHTMITDVEAPMIDVDAPFEPRIEQTHFSEPTPPAPIIAPQDVASSPALLDVPISDDLMSNASSESLGSAQVPFDFDFDAKPPSPEAFETAYQTPEPTHVEAAPIADVQADVNVPLTAEPFITDNDVVFSPLAPQDIDAIPSEIIEYQDDTLPGKEQDFTTSDIDNIFEPHTNTDDITLPSVEMPDVEPSPTESFAPSDIPDDAFYDGETQQSNITDPVATYASDQPNSAPQIIVPEDPSDDAFDLDVATGVLGKLNKQSLMAADVGVVQAIFDRASALQTKLVQAS